VLGNEPEANIEIIRKNGADGIVTVDYETFEIDKSLHTASADVDFKHVKGTLTFAQNVTSNTIEIPILPGNGEQEERDESFGLRLINITPDGAKLSKKNFIVINIITDKEGKKKSDAMQALLDKFEAEEEQTWGSQFISACKLHPVKNEEGEIEDITFMDGLLHFVCIGWKLVFSLIPPPHYAGGWACFIMALVMIGIVTYVVGEFANLFGCVLGIKPAITAITFVALGTSLPDTFASMVAASSEKYADSAVGNVTGSNSVNVFLGLGLPWVIAVIWETGTPASVKGYESNRYFVPSLTLGFSVMVFVIVSLVAFMILIIRRQVVGGELGGTQKGRTISACALTSLWLVYVLLSIC
jgi:solute carrier family 8 (sodium/calcium exchanger)